MRVGIDGLILAANDAALGLLGAQQPAQVLGGYMTTWITPAHQEAWREFSQFVASGTSQSVECDLTDVSGAHRSVVFHGVPLVDHTDGIPSLILGARDATALRRLEAALQESEAMRQKLAAEQSQHPMENLSGRLQELEAKVSRLPQLEQLLKQGRTHLQDLRTRLDEATKERNQLAAQLSDREASNEQLWTEQAQLQQGLAEQQQTELNALHTQLQEATAARDGLTSRLTELEAEREQLSLLRIKLDEATSEKDQLVAQLAERIGEHERTLTEQEERQRVEEERQRLENDQQQQSLNALRADMNQIMADRQRLADQIRESEASLREAETSRQQLAVDHDAERARFEEALGTAVARHKESEKALADHRVELQSMDLAFRRVEPFAAAGRLATDVAHELLTAVADIDARAACLLAECPVESSNREEVEQLRADSVRAAALTRQILQARQITHSEERK